MAVSGGRDSLVLLDLLLHLVHPKDRSLAVLHFHHGSGEHADRALAAVTALCREHGLALEVGRFAEDRAPRAGGIEARWREARYAWFAACLDPEGVLLTAHHADDRLESLVLSLLRGGGGDGWTAMGRTGVMRPFASGYLLRPLLDWRRAEIEAYARARKLPWVEDPGNSDETRARVFVRRRVVGPLARRWPSAARTAARGLDALAEDEERLRRITAEKYAEVVHSHVLEVTKIRACPPSERRALLRLWLVQHGGAKLPRPRFALLEEACSGDGARALEVRGEEGRCYALFAGGLYALLPLPAVPPADWEGIADERGVVMLPSGYGKLFLRGGEGGHVRFRRGGECLAWGREGTRLQEFLRRRRVPPWLRSRLPLVLVEGRIRAVAPRWVEESWRARGGGVVWIPDSVGLIQALQDVEERKNPSATGSPS